jgi:hypothetical protein
MTLWNKGLPVIVQGMIVPQSYIYAVLQCYNGDAGRNQYSFSSEMIVRACASLAFLLAISVEALVYKGE